MDFKKMFESSKGGDTDVLENNTVEEKAKKAIDKDPTLKKAYDSWVGKKDKLSQDMQEKFLQAVMAYPGQPIGYNKFDESFVPVQYQGFN